jgi:tetratricopeptide (TPR) repeat protein
VFAHAFLPNLLIFLLGQAAAYGYLRTGRTARGVSLMVGAFVLADIALLARFGFANAEDVFLAALIGMQAWSLAEFAVFTFGRIRRRLPGVQRRREIEFREAFLAYLRDEYDVAMRLFRRLLRRDPWDTESMLGLATVLDRRGKRRQARSHYRRARSLDREGLWQDVIREELRRFAAGRTPARPSTVTARVLPEAVEDVDVGVVVERDSGEVATHESSSASPNESPSKTPN